MYVASLSQYAFCVGGNCSGWPGWSILIFGILALPGSLANATWLANPILFASWIVIWQREKRLSVVLSSVALMFAAAFLLMGTVVTNEGGVPSPITGFKIGYWLWLGSMVAAWAAARVSNVRAEISK